MARGRRNADEVFLAAYACGSTIESAATKAGISPRTAYHRLKDPKFQKRIAELKDDILRRTGSMLTAAGLESVKTLLDLQNPKTPAAVRLGAAKATIELGARLRNDTEIAERIADLEAQLQSGETCDER